MSIVHQIQKDMQEVEKKITEERVKGHDKRDKKKVQKLQREYAALQIELSKALAGKTTRKINAKDASKSKKEEEEIEEEEEETDEDDDDDDD